MRWLMLPIAVAGPLAAIQPALAKVEAPFIDGAYTMNPEACAKLKALAAGTPRSLGTVPWSVSAKGIDSGEGGCSFIRVQQRKPTQTWSIEARCHSHDPDGPSSESYVFTRTSPTTFAVRLTTKGTSAADRKPVTYTKCDTGKPGGAPK